MSTHFFGDTALLLGRSMRHITRSPDTIITTAITPIAIMLLFVYVFGGAIQVRHRQLRQLPAAWNHADRDRVGHRVHRRSVVHRYDRAASSSDSIPCRSNDRPCCGHMF